MKMSTRMMLPAAVAACFAFAVTGAQAGHGCKADVEAEVVVHGTGPAARHHARHGAVHAWKHKVAHKYGWAYARWSAADDRRVDCDTHRGKTECEVEASPCH